MTSIPLVYSFWFLLAADVVHIIDEFLLGGSFVAKVQQHWWPQYSWRKFFWFNTGYLIIMSASIVLYDRFGPALLFHCSLVCLASITAAGVRHKTHPDERRYT